MKIINDFIVNAGNFINKTGWTKGIIIIILISFFSNSLAHGILDIAGIESLWGSLVLTWIFSFLILNNVGFGIFLKEKDPTK